MEQTVKCPICSLPYKTYSHYARDQSACPRCRGIAAQDEPKYSPDPFPTPFLSMDLTPDPCPTPDTTPDFGGGGGGGFGGGGASSDF